MEIANNLNTFSVDPSVFNKKSEEINIVDQYKNLFYKCKFTEILETVDQQLSSCDSISDYYKLVMIKAKSYFELNRRDLANECLKLATADNAIHKQTEYFYTKGSFYYFQGDMESAKECFKNMLEGVSDDQIVFKSLLALGNIAYSEGQTENALEYISELDKMAKNLPLELNLSLNHLKANVLLADKKDVAKARELLEVSYQQSILNDWPFFAQRSLYNLAKWYRNTGAKGEALGMLSVLDMNLRMTDSRFLSYLVNNEFHAINHRSTQVVQLETEMKTVIIGQTDQYKMELGKWPKLFTFLELIFEAKDFVSKERIANEIWPEQKYLPKTHDPRIYDIVARLKKKIELVDDAPLLIEAGAGGYKLNIS